MVAQSNRLGRTQIAIVTGGYEEGDHSGEEQRDYETASDPVTTKLPQPTTSEQLYYLEQMALDMKRIAQSEGFETLSGIFDMAHREAQLRRGG